MENGGFGTLAQQDNHHWVTDETIADCLLAKWLDGNIYTYVRTTINHP